MADQTMPRSADNDEPMVSCLMVTANRAQLARRAIACLAEQTWSNLELVIVDDGDEDYSPILEPFRNRLRIRYERIAKEPGVRLGSLRNRSLDLASGDYCAQWDDDEWYHPDRIETQMRYLRTRDLAAVTLRYVLVHLDEPDFLHHPFRFDSIDGTCGTILHERSDIRYPNLERSEDLAYLETFTKTGRSGVIPERSGHLFVRCFHGTNTWDREHFLGRLKSSAIGTVDYYFSRYLLGSVFRHHAFKLCAAENAAVSDFLEMSRALGLLRNAGQGNSNGEAGSPG